MDFFILQKKKSLFPNQLKAPRILGYADSLFKVRNAFMNWREKMIRYIMYRNFFYKASRNKMPNN